MAHLVVGSVPAGRTDNDVAALEALPLELEVLPPDHQAGAQPLVLTNLSQRLEYLLKKLLKNGLVAK